MRSVIAIAVAMIICEIIIGFVFSVIAQKFYKKSEIDIKSIFKGFIERLFITLFLYNDLPHALTFFSALKLATRLKHDDASGETEKFNNYYLIGNLVSVSLALLYVYIWQNITEIENGLARLFGG